MVLTGEVADEEWYLSGPGAWRRGRLVSPTGKTLQALELGLASIAAQAVQRATGGRPPREARDCQHRSPPTLRIPFIWVKQHRCYDGSMAKAISARS